MKQVAHSEPVEQRRSVEPRRTVAKQPASASTAASDRPSSYKPSRSEAVEALLAANRKTSRSRHQAAAPANRPPKPDVQIKSVAVATPKATPAQSTRSGAVPAKPKLASAAKSETKQSQVRKTTTGKTVRFNDLPDDVKRRAMDRLIENLAKQAVPSVQPSSPQQGVADALSNLPKLAPLRKTKPEILPTRIAANRSKQSQRTASSQQVAQTRQKNKPARSMAKASVPPPPSEPKKVLPSRKVAAAPAVAVASGFDLPPMDQIRKSVPKLDSAKVVMSRDTVSSANQWDLSPETNLTTAAIDAEYAEIKKEADAIELTVSALAKELEVIPHELQRDTFRVSRVGLPDPDDYFADIDQEIRQASSQGDREHEALQTVELANSVTRENPSDLLKPAGRSPVPTKAQQPAATSEPTLSVGELTSHHQVAGEPTTPAFELPKRLEPTSTQSAKKQQFELPAAKAVVSIDRPTTAIKNLSANRPPAAITESTASVSQAASEDLSADSVGKTEPDTVAKVVARPSPESLSDRELYDALLKRLSNPAHAESPAEQSRRQIMARHLMVLAGDREAAVAQMHGLSVQEQQFLRNQLEGLYAMVDPKGHPVAGRRFSQALPKLRQATQHLSAAAESLEVRGLEFCTEIEAYGQVKPFPTRNFAAGQAVILYCEVDRFTAKQTESGYETHLKGSYDVFDQSGVKVVSQLLPADKQLSRNFLRDYFVAYQMNLPSKLAKGKYRLQLTMEDIGGEKYGQAEIEFEIIKAASEVRQAGGTL